uniref:Uncharacterized protein n=3 Tax=viral metagenome TaxID=1070528 RepID=A0A6M3KNG5_9ZZZZ
MFNKIFRYTLILFVALGLIFSTVPASTSYALERVVTIGGTKPYKNISEFLLFDNLTEGNVWYVNSNIALSGGAGKAWGTACATLDAAINKAGEGDIIFIADNHTESFTAADGFDADVAGITIIGLGNGADRATFTFANTAATVAIGAANVTIDNVRFLAGISDIVTGISVEVGGDNLTLRNCEFPIPTTATFEFLNVITLATGADDFTIENCKYRGGATSATNHFLYAGTGINSNLKVVNSDIQGLFAIAGIWSNKVDTLGLIANNTILNSVTGQHCIEFTTTATGMIVNNRLYGDTYAATLDPGSMFCLGNLASAAIDLDGVPIPTLPAIGTVTAGSADDILKKLYYTADGTGNYPATVAQESALSYIMSKSASAAATSYNNTTDSLEAIRDVIDTNDTANQIDIDAILADTITISGGTLPVSPTSGSLATFVSGGGTALGTPLATSKSLVDAIGTNGTTVADTATGIAGMIGVDDADNVMATSSVASNRDGSVFERLEHIAKYLETGTPGALVAPANTFTILDILGTDGSTTTGAVAGSILGAIGTNEAAAATAFTSSAVEAEANGSVLERLEALQVSAGPSYIHPKYLAVATGTFDTTGVWSTVASHEIATVTGMVKVTIIPECVTSVSSVSDTGTIQLGDETVTSSVIAASTLGAGAMAAGELWVDATLTRTILTQTQVNAITFVVAAGKDIGYEVATNALSAGSMIFHIWWTPLDATGAVAAGAGGTL